MKKFSLFLTILLVCLLCVMTAKAETYAVPLPGEVTGTESVIGNAIRVSITDLAIAVISLIFTVIFGLILRFIIPPLRKWINANCTREEKNMIDDIIYKTVLAAEQILGAGMGKTKLKYVQDKLLEKGIEIDLDAIEAAVFKMNHHMIDGILMSDEAEREVVADNDADGEF